MDGLGWVGLGGAGRSRADSQSNVRWDQLELAMEAGKGRSWKPSWLALGWGPGDQ